MVLTGVEYMARILDLICGQDARHRLVIALLAATVVSLSLRGRVRPSTEVIATWDAFVFCVLFLAWLTILTTPVHKLRSRAKEQDVSRLVIFVFVVVAACAALFAVGFLISVNKAVLRGHFTAHLLLALGTVIFSWSVVHTAFGLRYAHAFYGDSDQPGERRHAGGLLFSLQRTDARLFRFCLLFVRYRDDLPGLGCSNYLAKDAATNLGAERALFWLQHRHPGPSHQHRLQPSLIER